MSGQGQLFRFETPKQRIEPPFSGRPTVLCVPADHRVKVSKPNTYGGMIGKIVQHPTQGWVYFTAFRGNKSHQKTDCPCPIDTVVAEWCLQNGIEICYAYDRDRRLLRRGALGAIVRAEAALYDGLRRFYMPERDWELRVDVSEWAEGGTRFYGWDNPVRVFLSVPFIKEPLLTLRDPEAF